MKCRFRRLLAARLAVPFLDGDDYHPVTNIAKMSAGQPLTDEDRWPWLDALGIAMRHQAQTAGAVVAACSALRRVYRDRLIAAAGEPVWFVHLDLRRENLQVRLDARAHHFMPATLLESQLATLEPPSAEENALTIAVDAPVEAIVARTCSELAAFGAPLGGAWPHLHDTTA